ncbi:peptide chain release factor N(5)-glutamine methyltransferase [Filomicrobium sp.]|uniref:peptide chain release factor N(5)-glutamine methyltransferase n=1 Tax=Filomicrobium sp. TaxID=2024831 RepID=UPI002583B626|nr:peptide chain release factor N(5)-glutamine methyltransferase [Filomicrobium sp.]MCV0368317.1 peptide chain release factor N(5)-glutamine methyltransferase [Filomicrobium sp.]
MPEASMRSGHKFAAEDSLADAVVRSAAMLAGFDEPRREARRLVAAAAEMDAAQLIAAPDSKLGAPAALRLDEILVRRLAHEPLSRILGSREFFGREFALSSETLDPRPDTEVLIEAAKELAHEEGWYDRPFHLIDVGTGTGILAITMLAEFSNATALATDISAQALATAQSNAERLGVADRIRFLEARSLKGVEGSFDLLMSNPPYIVSADIGTLDAEVRLYDPLAALDGGPDGLQVYREIVADLSHSVPQGWALFEVGADQASDVAGLLKGQEVRELRMWKDLGNHTRCVAGRTQF